MGFVTVCALLYAPVRLVAEANPGWSLVTWPLALIAITLTLLFLHLGTPNPEPGERKAADGFQLSAFPVLAFAFPLCFFLVAVPWPFVLEDRVIQGLTRLNTALTVEVLGWFGIPALPHGNVIELASGSVGIDEACSGIRSLQATLMISLFLGELYRLGVWRRTLAVFTGFGMAMVCNLARMLLLCWVAADRGVDAIAGWHDPAGVTILVACFLGVWGVSATMGEKGEGRRMKDEGRRERAEVGLGNAGSGKQPSEVANQGLHGPRKAEIGKGVQTRNGEDAESGEKGEGRRKKEEEAEELKIEKLQLGTQGAEISDFRFQRFRSSAARLCAIYLIVWFAFVEISVAAWYWHVEANLPAQKTWRIAWPEAAEGFRDVVISHKATEMLRYDEARQAQWLEADGSRWQLSWFFWKPGRAAGYLAKGHSPMICMPAAGYEVASVSAVEVVGVRGLRLPARIYRFQQEAGPVHVLYSRWEDRAVEQSFASEGTSRFSRLQSVWRGRGNHGQRVVSLALWGTSDSVQAHERLLQQLERVVLPEGEGGKKGKVEKLKT